MERNSPLTHSDQPTLRHHLTPLLQSANSFRHTFSLNLSDIVDKLESFGNAMEYRYAEIEKKESLLDLRLGEVEKKEAELGCLDASLEAKLRDVKTREDECEQVFAELRAVEDCVDDRMRRAEAERLNLERWVKEEEKRIEGMKRECSRDLEERRKEVEGRQRECEKKLEEFERLKLREIEVEKQRKEVELQCKKKLEEVERLKESINEGFKLKEKEVEERQKLVELKELNMQEIDRRNQSVYEELKLKESELEKRRKEVELKEVQVKNRLEELIRLKQSVSEGAKKREKELDMREKEMELKEMEFKKKLEEIERSKKIASEALKLKETELKKQQKELELVDIEFKKKLGEIEKLKQSAFEALKVKEKELELEFNKKFEEHERSKLVDFEELERKKKELNKQQKGLELKELEVKKKSEELERLKLVVSEELKRKEKEFEKQREVELKEMECNNLEELERSKQIISDALDLKEKEVEKHRKEFESKELYYKKKLEEHERDRERILKDLKIRQNHVEKKRKNLELKEKNLDERFNMLRGKEMEIKKRSEELHLREQKCESRSKENELENKNILARCQEVDLENVKLTERVRMEEAKIDEQLKKIDWEKDQLLIRYEIADLDNRKFIQRVKELELKEKQLEERFREVELKKKRAADNIDTHVKREPLDADNILADAGLCFNVKMDGKALQIFLNERERDHEFLRNEVTAALSLSLNPAKLVLDAIQGFYPPHFGKGDIEFKEHVVRRSCILLLEQLQKISPFINPHVKKEAAELAFDWKRKMRADDDHSLEVLGFLRLLAAYKLASEFNADDLLRCLESVAYNSKAPELFRVLGFAVHVSSFIETLVRKKKHIEAIGFVFAFDLVSEFPPVPLLKDFLKLSRTGRRKLDDFDAKIEALYQRREDAKAALKCIQHHRLESDISPKRLELQINDLDKQIAEIQKKMPAPGCRLWSTSPDVRTQSSSNVATAVNSASTPKSAPFTSTKVDSTAAVRPAIKASSQTGIKRPRCITEDDFDVPSAEILPQKPIGASRNDVNPRVSAVKIEQPSGQVSELLSSEHGISDSLPHENSNDHQLDLKPVECALDAIKRFRSLELENDKSASLGVSEERCISLFENLRNTPHLFDPQVKGEVLKFAADWKAQLMENRSNQRNVVLFAEFLAAFGLASSFPANDLLLLLDSNSGRKTSSDLCQLLGLADKIPDFIESLIQRNQRIEAAKYINVLRMNDKFPIVSLLSDHWSYYKRTGQRLCNHSIISQIEAIREERDALAAIINCFEAYNLQSQGQMSPQILREHIVQLEKQKVLKEAELDKVKPSARLKSISLQQQKISANCSTEATANSGMKGPEICPKTAVVSPLVTGTNQSPDFASTAAPNPVTISPPASSFSSADKPALARTVNLLVDTVPLTVVACSSAPTDSSRVASNSLPSSNHTHKLTSGSSPLPTAAKAVVAPSSTRGPPSTSVPKTHPQRQAENKRRKVVVSSGPPL